MDAGFKHCCLALWSKSLRRFVWTKCISPKSIPGEKLTHETVRGVAEICNELSSMHPEWFGPKTGFVVFVSRPAAAEPLMLPLDFVGPPLEGIAVEHKS